MIGKIDFTELESMKYWAPPSSWTQEKKQETTRTRIFSGEWYGAEKKDGYFCRFVKDEDGQMYLQSRSRGVNGTFPNKYEWVPHLHQFFESLPNGTVVLGELYLPSKPGSSNITSILGCLKEKAVARQEKGEKLHLYVFDILAFNGKSYLNTKFIERIQNLSVLKPLILDDKIELANYYNGKELWLKLEEILYEGGEGIVMTKYDSTYKPGKRPSKECQKVKKEINNTIDCFFTGAASAPTREYTGKEIETWQYWENLQTKAKLKGEFYKEYSEGSPIEPITKPYFNNWAGSLEIGVVKGDKVVPIGFLSGIADELKADPKALKGKTIEVSCMEVLPTGGLRHAKMLQFRNDKNWKECKWEDVFGE